MPTPSSKVWTKNDGQEPVNVCPVCHDTAIRDEKLLDLLQTAMIALTAVDGYDDWRIRAVRFKASIREAMQLMQGRQW